MSTFCAGKAVNDSVRVYTIITAASPIELQVATTITTPVTKVAACNSKDCNTVAASDSCTSATSDAVSTRVALAAMAATGAAVLALAM